MGALENDCGAYEKRDAAGFIRPIVARLLSSFVRSNPQIVRAAWEQSSRR
jgi:hypothetical protein